MPYQSVKLYTECSGNRLSSLLGNSAIACSLCRLLLYLQDANLIVPYNMDGGVHMTHPGQSMTAAMDPNMSMDPSMDPSMHPNMHPGLQPGEEEDHFGSGIEDEEEEDNLDKGMGQTGGAQADQDAGGQDALLSR